MSLNFNDEQSLPLALDAILVPQGAEWQAVSRGLSQINSSKPVVLPIPIGFQAVSRELKKWQQPPQKVLLMGLCGSLSSRYRVGDLVVYEKCIQASDGAEILCDRVLTNQVYRSLGSRAALVTGLSTEIPICTTKEKLRLGNFHQAEVVDMEGFAVLSAWKSKQIATAIIRVVSDDTLYDLPNLTSAITESGKLRAFPLATSFLRQPLAAARLIRGSLRGLKILQQVAVNCCSSC
ncbi:MAG: phosphorylase [Oscillatoria sp. PMC 1051.18]|nr:phosphorylase [Oscillatoria sp. PMC 1050.18]MEC5030987.1 phosphorylase [Oscillatoria sp. PMC 1051.18]